MAKKEANFDLYIHQLLCESGIKADTQGSNNVEIDNALKTASKHRRAVLDGTDTANRTMIRQRT